MRVRVCSATQPSSVNIYKNISLFKFSEDECKKKWKTLRIQQRRIIIAKIKKKEKSSAIQWHYYDSLKFLIPHMDWTATDEQSIKTETDLDLSMLPELCTDAQDEPCEETYENDERCDSISDESSYSSSHQVFTTETTADASSAARDTMCANTQQILTTTESTYQPQYLLATAVGDQISHQTVQQQTQPAMFEPSTTTVTTVDANKYQMNNRIITVPVTTAPSIVNYFLMDVAVQMERLNDIAQMEMKIEIHRLLLEKLKNINNLRQPQSMCFATPANHN